MCAGEPAREQIYHPASLPACRTATATATRPGAANAVRPGLLPQQANADPWAAATVVVTVVTALSRLYHGCPASPRDARRRGCGAAARSPTPYGLPSPAQAGRDFVTRAGGCNLGKLQFIQAKRKGELDNPRGMQPPSQPPVDDEIKFRSSQIPESAHYIVCSRGGGAGGRTPRLHQDIKVGGRWLSTRNGSRREKTFTSAS